MPNKFSYIKTDGSQGIVDANSPTEALSIAPGIARDSGVQLQPTPTPTPTISDPKKTPPTTPPATSLVDRYSKDKAAIVETYSENNKPDENTIRQQERSNAQASIDLINGTFAKYLEQDKTFAANIEAEQRAASALGGLTGSTVGASNATKAATVGLDKIQKTELERTNLVNQAIAAADSRASVKFQDQLQKYISNKADKVKAEAELNDKIKNTALGEIKAIAGHQTFDEIKRSNPNLITQYLKETNMDENTLKDYFLAQTPEADFVNKEGTRIGNDTVFFTKKMNPQTGELEIKEAGRISGTGKEIQSTSINKGVITVLYKDGTYETKGAGVNPTTSTPNGKSYTSGGLTLSGEDLSQGEQILNSSRGADGHVDSGVYKAAYDKWIVEKGLAKDFIDKFPPKIYANPNDESLPPYLRPPKAKGSTNTNQGS